MPWIKMRSELRLDPDVIQIALETNLDEFAVVGRLHAVWSWLDQHSEDGTNVRISSAFLDRLAACPGFAAAMRSVGWLSGQDGAITFPGYTEHNGETAKRRAMECKKKQSQRAGADHRDKCPASNGIPVGTKSGPEERRGEKEGGGTRASAREPEPPPPDFPEGKAKPPTVFPPGGNHPSPTEPAGSKGEPPPPNEVGAASCRLADHKRLEASPTSGATTRGNASKPDKQESEPPPPNPLAEIPTEADLLAFGARAGIPPGYCANFHTKTTEKRVWLNAYGRVVDWQRQIARFWATDRPTWNEPIPTPKDETWKADWLLWLEKSGHPIARNREYQFADPLVKDAFWKARKTGAGPPPASQPARPPCPVPSAQCPVLSA